MYNSAYIILIFITVHTTLPLPSTGQQYYPALWCTVYANILTQHWPAVLSSTLVYLTLSLPSTGQQYYPALWWICSSAAVSLIFCILTSLDKVMCTQVYCYCSLFCLVYTTRNCCNLLAVTGVTQRTQSSNSKSVWDDGLLVFCFGVR